MFWECKGRTLPSEQKPITLHKQQCWPSAITAFRCPCLLYIVYRQRWVQWILVYWLREKEIVSVPKSASRPPHTSSERSASLWVKCWAQPYKSTLLWASSSCWLCGNFWCSKESYFSFPCITLSREKQSILHLLFCFIYLSHPLQNATIWLWNWRAGAFISLISSACMELWFSSN